MNAHARIYPFESPREYRARKEREAVANASRVRLDAVNEKIAIRRKDMRQAYADLPGAGYGSGPDEYDSWLIDRFELARDLLRQAYHERGRIRRELA